MVFPSLISRFALMNGSTRTAKILTLLPLTLLAMSLYADQNERITEEARVAGAEGIEFLDAFRTGYPDKAGEVSFTADGWAITVGGATIYWADGRLLDADRLAAAERFTPHPFYTYPSQLPELKAPTEDQKRLIEARVARREESPPTRNPGMYNAIWRIEDRASAWEQNKTAFFMGKKLLIHRDLLDELASIEEELFFLAETDPVLEAYIKSLNEVAGYSWRPIAGTASLSYHSYGAAIDFLPKSTSGKEIYWRWAQDRYAEWYILPYEQRLMPPTAFVTAFEKRGFVWGGKWFYFDTMHFEYRPEILALNGYTHTWVENPVTGVRELSWIPPGEQ